jgi:hypothetical protein
VALSQKGCRVLEEGILARHGWLLELSEILSREEKDQITAALEVMIRTAQQENPN